MGIESDFRKAPRASIDVLPEAFDKRVALTLRLFSQSPLQHIAPRRRQDIILSLDRAFLPSAKLVQSRQPPTERFFFDTRITPTDAMDGIHLFQLKKSKSILSEQHWPELPTILDALTAELASRLSVGSTHAMLAVSGTLREQMIDDQKEYQQVVLHWQQFDLSRWIRSWAATVFPLEGETAEPDLERVRAKAQEHILEACDRWAQYCADGWILG
jgi:hypothetical protein